MPTCQGKATETSRTDTFAAFVGIDWADKEHAICVLDGDQNTSDQLKHSAEAIDAWATRMHQQFGGRGHRTISRRIVSRLDAIRAPAAVSDQPQAGRQLSQSAGL